MTKKNRTISVCVFAMVLSGCADPAFDVAPSALDETDTRKPSELRDSGVENGADDLGSDSGVRDTAGADDTREASAIDSGVDTGSPSTDTEAIDSVDTSPIDTGCPLYAHDDPMSGTSFESCLPTGVVGDPSTYSIALLDDEIAHAKSHTPSITWGSPTTTTCDGVDCTTCSLTVDAGIAYATWCAGGALAGYFLESSVGAGPPCPTAAIHGVWR
jgi:hypothetical protein